MGLVAYAVCAACACVASGFSTPAARPVSRLRASVDEWQAETKANGATSYYDFGVRAGVSAKDWAAACEGGVVSYTDYGLRLPTAAPAAPAAAPAAVAPVSFDGATVNYGDVFKYVSATAAQLGLFAAAFTLFDKCIPFKLPQPAVFAMFAFLSLRSRIFSLLDNSRPDRDSMDGKATPAAVLRPKWTPPGKAFPVIWLSITALRGVAAALVYGQTQALASAPLLALVGHLCIGDTWNTITNVEKRLGVSAVGCVVVWASVGNAVLEFSKVSQLAARVLAPSFVWISIATVLTANIWTLNTPRRPLFPSPADGDSAKIKLFNLFQLQPNSIGGKGK